MISKNAKDAFWGTVTECLVAFHGLSDDDARERCRELRQKLEDLPWLLSKYADMVYDTNPFYCACDIAGEQKDIDRYSAEYDEVLKKHNW